jgi:glycosyltransferase involved in cell wall biosynthesis
MPDISVIICAHNPRSDYLRRTLEALQMQTLPFEQWELVLVDNASNRRLAECCDISWHPCSRHMREEELGLTSARLRGIHESSGELVVFIDDDNVVAPDFLVQALDIAARYPFLGVFGAGIIEPEFEVSPAYQLKKLSSLLALRRIDRPRWSNHFADSESIPWGAGMCITRQVANEYPNLLAKLENTFFIDRRGDYLFCGGDDLFSFVSSRLGEGFGLFPSLRVTHLIRSERLTKAYFLRLVCDKHMSNAILRYELLGIEPRKTSLLQKVRTLFHGLKNGRFWMRYHGMALKGEDRAARVIQQTRLAREARHLNCSPISEKP